MPWYSSECVLIYIDFRIIFSERWCWVALGFSLKSSKINYLASLYLSLISVNVTHSHFCWLMEEFCWGLWVQMEQVERRRLTGCRFTWAGLIFPASSLHFMLKNSCSWIFAQFMSNSWNHLQFIWLIARRCTVINLIAEFHEHFSHILGKTSLDNQNQLYWSDTLISHSMRTSFNVVAAVNAMVHSWGVLGLNTESVIIYSTFLYIQWLVTYSTFVSVFSIFMHFSASSKPQLFPSSTLLHKPSSPTVLGVIREQRGCALQ